MCSLALGCWALRRCLSRCAEGWELGAAEWEGRMAEVSSGSPPRPKYMAQCETSETRVLLLTIIPLLALPAPVPSSCTPAEHWEEGCCL